MLGLDVDILEIKAGLTSKRRERRKGQGQTDRFAVDLGDEGLRIWARSEQVLAKVVGRGEGVALQLLIDRQLVYEVHDCLAIFGPRPADGEALLRRDLWSRGAVARRLLRLV